MPVRIDGNIPGGNIVVADIHGDDIRLHQDLRDTTCNWFYWCSRVRGAEERTLRFQFTKSRALGVRGPAFSNDQGKTWRWLGAESVQGNCFVYTFAQDAVDIQFSFGMPYQESHWRHFTETFGNNAYLSFHTLCTTAKGREIEYVLLGCLHAESIHRIAITCRHHCCEMMANYVMEGLIRWIAEDIDSSAEWLRKNVQFLLVPFMDKDGVEDGDQGKNRKPRDHCRDYEGKSIYASTAAIRCLLPEWGGDRLRVALDLHCPWIAGRRSESIDLVGSEYDHVAQEQKMFSGILESVRKGPLPFYSRDFLSFGSEWNTEANYAGGKTFVRWSIEKLPSILLGTSIEVPYANASGFEVNQASARFFGRDLAEALAVYLRSIKRYEKEHPVKLF